MMIFVYLLLRRSMLLLRNHSFCLLLMIASVMYCNATYHYTCWNKGLSIYFLFEMHFSWNSVSCGFCVVKLQSFWIMQLSVNFTSTRVADTIIIPIFMKAPNIQWCFWKQASVAKNRFHFSFQRANAAERQAKELQEQLEQRRADHPVEASRSPGPNENAEESMRRTELELELSSKEKEVRVLRFVWNSSQDIIKVHVFQLLKMQNFLHTMLSNVSSIHLENYRMRNILRDQTFVWNPHQVVSHVDGSRFQALSLRWLQFLFVSSTSIPSLPQVRFCAQLKRLLEISELALWTKVVPLMRSVELWRHSTAPRRGSRWLTRSSPLSTGHDGGHMAI